MVTSLENHARAALEDNASDPARHTTIRDFQTRLEQLGALTVNSKSQLVISRPALSLKGLHDSINQIKLVEVPKTPRLFSPSDSDRGPNHVTIGWEAVSGALHYEVKYWKRCGSGIPEESVTTCSEPFLRIEGLRPNAHVTCQVTAC